MSGQLKPGWQWGAAGKHPVVKDYIRIGQATPLLNDLARWVEKGYRTAPADAAPRSWRFFAKGAQRDELACGLVRDSRDGVGRAFPLLVIGTGLLEGWAARWEMVSRACETTWERMEYLATKRVFDLHELKGDLERLPAPAWPVQGDPVAPAPESPRMEGGVVSLPLSSADQDGEVAAWLMRLQRDAAAAPEAIFIGGLMEHPRVVVFSRTLNATDFERLWMTA